MKRKKAGRSLFYGGILIVIIGMFFLFASILLGAIIGAIGILIATVSINLRHTRI
jgi:hypothetical protein